MALFAIYKVKFFEAQSKTLDNRLEDGKPALEYAQYYFRKLFLNNDLAVFRHKKADEQVLYPNDIMKIENDIILLRLNNVKMTTICKKVESPRGGLPEYVDFQEESNPYSYVVIDNRKGVCQMAIQMSAAWGKNTDLVRNVLQESFRHALESYDLDILIDSKINPNDFWQYVEAQLDNGDTITKVSFDFPNFKRVAALDLPQKLRNNIKAMSELVEIMRGLKGHFTVETSGNNALELKQKNRDLAQMVLLCSNNAYGLTVHFKHKKAYKVGQEIIAQFRMDDKTIDDFYAGVKELDNAFTLTKWLDYVREQTMNYRDGIQAKSHGKKAC